jgi:hypothetical protein
MREGEIQFLVRLFKLPHGAHIERDGSSGPVDPGWRRGHTRAVERVWAVSIPADLSLVVRPEGPGLPAAIIADVAETPLALDSSPDIERRQVESWRQMSAAQKAAMITGLTRAAYAMSAAGVRHRHPDASSREQFLRLAIIVLGPDLARLAFPDSAGLISR